MDELNEAREEVNDLRKQLDMKGTGAFSKNKVRRTKEDVRAREEVEDLREQLERRTKESVDELHEAQEAVKDLRKQLKTKGKDVVSSAVLSGAVVSGAGYRVTPQS